VTISDGAAERRIVSVLFADLVGFTTLSENLDAEDVAAVQDAYFATVREVIGRYGGQLEKFIGDAAMAVFGVPRGRDDDAERAVRAGLALIGAVERLGAQVGLEDGVLRVRVGVNTGEVVHATAGTDAGRVTGDTVNVAARLQTAADPGTVLVGEGTAMAVAETIELADAHDLELKGKAAAVRARVATGALAERSRDRAMGRLQAPILGRNADLDALRAALGEARHGRAALMLVVAPPGVGKSRLVREFSGELADDPDVVTWVGRLRPDGGAPFDAVAQILRAAVGSGEGDLEAVLAASGTGPARASLVAAEVRATMTGMPSAAGQADRELRFGAWLEALDALAGSRTAVLLFEDVHWGGPDLLAFLRAASDGSATGDGGTTGDGSPGRLVLATARPSLLERQPELGESNAAVGHHVLPLAALPATDATALIRALVGDALPDELVRSIAERSDGNPLFIEELLRTWVGVGVLQPAGDGWTMPETPHGVDVPATVLSVYGAQLDDLPPAARAVARRGAVAGRRFAEAALGALDAPPDGVPQLRDRALISGPTDDVLGDVWMYRHALLRDAGYASLARAERARLHVRLARWLELVAGPQPAAMADAIGHHYAAAIREAPALAADLGDDLSRGDGARAAGNWLEQAASVARAGAAHETARALLREAIDLTPATDRLDLARRKRKLGEATADTASKAEGMEILREAVDGLASLVADSAATGGPDAVTRDEAARAVAALGQHLLDSVRFADARLLAEEWLERLGAERDPSTARLVILRSAAMIYHHPEPSTMADLEAVADMLGDDPDPALRLWLMVLGYQLAAERGSGGPDDLATRQAAIIRLAREIGDVGQESRQLRFRALTAAEVDVGTALSAIESAAALTDAHRMTEEGAWVDYVRSEVGLFSGAWDAALLAGHRALEVAERHAYHRVAVRTWFVVTEIAAERGEREDLVRADAWLRARTAETPFPESPFGLVTHYAVSRRLAAAGIADRWVVPDGVMPGFDDPPGMPSWYASLRHVLVGLLEEGRLETADDAMARLLAGARDPSVSAAGQAIVELLRAQVEMAHGADRQDAVVEPVRDALVVLRQVGAQWWVRHGIGLLQQADSATPPELAEAAAVGDALGIPRS
jgi:class 3 adenylate cyclase